MRLRPFAGTFTRQIPILSCLFGMRPPLTFSPHGCAPIADHIDNAVAGPLHETPP